MTAHTVKNVKHSRGPNLDALWLPVCIVCGPLSPGPTDVDAARSKRSRHEAADHGAEVAG